MEFENYNEESVEASYCECTIFVCGYHHGGIPITTMTCRFDSGNTYNFCECY
ncbi:hypothetical protein J2S11_003563 [Bacillus horti]|uniref:Uncharacterized protein n=1 Tax=Caldalkalibacillus horti TaxID=77523 RepID=A0ABT9W319_9BACI|nr:hypothetical protein [Bacillus horti]